MAVQYTIEYRDSVMEVHVSGTPDRESLSQMWKDIVAATEAHNCLYILGLSNLDRPPKISDAIHHQAIFHEAGVTIDHRIAWVQLNPEAVATTRIAETILLNRGMLNGRLFDDEFEARRWLAAR
jgi:hypothetical protein